MEEQKKCVYGHPMTAAEWKNQWVYHRCGRTKILHEPEFEHRIKYACVVYKALLDIGWDGDTAASFLDSVPDTW